MSETHAPFWVYGAGRLRLRLAAPESLYPTLPPSVDGRVVRGSSSNGTLSLPLGPVARWHVIALNVDHLVPVAGRKLGLTIRALRVTYP